MPDGPAGTPPDPGLWGYDTGGGWSELQTYTDSTDNVYQDGLNQPYGSAAWYAGARKSDNSTGLLWNASSAQLGNYPDKYNVMTAISYVTGSHNIKVGFQDSWGVFNHVNRGNGYDWSR